MNINSISLRFSAKKQKPQDTCPSLFWDKAKQGAKFLLEADTRDTITMTKDVKGPDGKIQTETYQATRPGACR